MRAACKRIGIIRRLGFFVNQATLIIKKLFIVGVNGVAG
jgi:hypothetical protein